MSVCVSKNQRGSKKPAWLSVEHGDLKIKINSGVQNSYGPTRVYESYGPSGIIIIRTTSLWDVRNPEPDFESNLKYTPHRSLLYLKKSTNSEFFKLEHYSVFRINVKETSE